MKEWKKLVISKKYSRVIVQIPMSFFMYAGYDPNGEYEYKIVHDKQRRCLILRFRRKKVEGV